MKLGIQPLREKALEDIKKKVTLKTVVGEVFSWITAGYVSRLFFLDLQLLCQTVRAYAFLQSKGDLGDGMRSPNFEFQSPENDWPRETQHQTNLRGIFPPLCRCIETWVGQGAYAQEKYQLCEVAMLQLQLYMVQKPRFIFNC